MAGRGKLAADSDASMGGGPEIHGSEIFKAAGNQRSAGEEGIIRFWNLGPERTFGYPSDDTIRQSLNVILGEPLRKRHWDGHYCAIKNGGSRYAHGNVCSIAGIRKDGARVSMEFTIVPPREADRQGGDHARRYQEFRGDVRAKAGAFRAIAGLRMM